MTTETERRPMTARQQQIYEFVRTYRDSHGYCCNVREIAEAFSFSGNNAVVGDLWALRKKGWLTWQDGQPRTIRPVEVRDEQ